MIEGFSGYERLQLDRPASGVLRIMLRSENGMNTLDASAHFELTEIWRDADRDPSTRAILLCGDGKNFSAGGDLDLVEQMIADHKMCLRVMREARDLVRNIVECDTPTVAAIQGVAVGAGLAAALLSDISIASPDVRMMDGHVRLGVTAGDHAVLVWPLLCGMAKAKYHLLLNEPVDGRAAADMGLVSQCVEADQLQQTALDIATRLADGAPTALRWTKRALNHWYRTAIPAFEASLAHEFLGFAGAEVREGVASFREKRSPDFTKSPDGTGGRPGDREDLK